MLNLVHRFAGLLGLATLCLAGPISAEPAADAAATVVAFNVAISEGDADKAKQQLAAGGVQFTLRSMHDGVGPAELTAPLADHWSMIIPVIFSSTQRYSRQVEVLSSEAFGDIATVWVRTTTDSQRQGRDQPQVSEFTEVYMLITSGDGWKIAAIADNRQASSLSGN